MMRNSANFLVRFTFGSQAESNPDNDNHELSAFYVPDTVSVLLLILQFCNNKKNLKPRKCKESAQIHTAEPEILSQLRPTVTPSSLTTSQHCPWSPPPGPRHQAPTRYTTPSCAPGAQEWVPATCPLWCVTSDPSSCTPRPTRAEGPRVSSRLPRSDPGACRCGW